MPAKGTPITTSPDLHIVGGGLVGLSVAWRAAQRGARVVVLEAGDARVGRVARRRGHARAGRGGRGGRGGAQAARRSRLRALEGWPAVAEELREATGIDVGLRRTGTLVLARDADEAEALDRELAFRLERGLAVERLRPSEARRREPALAPTLRRALDVPGDASVDPRRVLEALAAACRALGVEIREGERVTELRRGPRRRRRRRVDGPARPGRARPPAQGPAAAAARPARGRACVERVLRFEGGYLVPRGDGALRPRRDDGGAAASTPPSPRAASTSCCATPTSSCPASASW